MTDTAEDRREVVAAEVALDATRAHLRKAMEAYDDARQRGRFTELPQLRMAIDSAWRAKVDAHLSFIETSLAATIRRLTEYVRLQQEVTAIMSGRGTKT